CKDAATYTKAREYAYNKSRRYQGQATSPVFFSVGSNAAGHTADTLYPARAVGVANTMYFIAADNFFCGSSCSKITLWKWTNPFGASSFVQRGGVNVATYGPPPDAPQSGSGTIATGDARELGAYWSNSTVYGTHAVSCNPG